MENLDEKYLGAARYLKSIESIAKDRVGHADAIRMAIFLLYLDLAGIRSDVLFAESLARPGGHVKAIARAYEEARAGYGLGAVSELDFDSFGESALTGLLSRTSEERSREEKILQFDYLVDALLSLLAQDHATLSAEKFIANFAKHLVARNVALVDLGRNSTGELAAKLDQASTLFLPNLMRGAEFEILLKLSIHGRRIERHDPTSRDSFTERAFMLHHPARKDARVGELRNSLHGDSSGDSGLTMAAWLSRKVKQEWTALTLLTLRDCRDRGFRSELRRIVTRSGCVRAVIEMPRRAATASRQFILLISGQSSAHSEDILFVDGRYCDVLRDEALERIAEFMSIPILARTTGQLERTWPDWRHDLGSELALRASKAFLGEQQGVRGLFA